MSKRHYRWYAAILALALIVSSFAGIAATPWIRSSADEQETMPITIEKTWSGDENEAGKRPDSVKFQILRNGTVWKDNVEVTAQDGWTTTIENAPVKDADGNRYDYQLLEVLPDGYESVIEKYEEIKEEEPDPGPVVVRYAIYWYNTDGSTLKSETRSGNEGETVSASDADMVLNGYTFLEDDPRNVLSVTAGSGDNIRLYFEKTNKEMLEIKYVDEDGTVLDTFTFEKGSTPPGTSKIPTKPEDDVYSYTFDRWSESADEAGNITMTAVYTATPIQKYTVTYTDGVDDETVFEDQIYTVKVNSVTPNFEGTPAREGYDFTGWNPAVQKNVTGDATYTAVWAKQDVPDPVTPTEVVWRDGNITLKTMTFEKEPTDDEILENAPDPGSTKYHVFERWEITRSDGHITVTGIYRDIEPEPTADDVALSVDIKRGDIHFVGDVFTYELKIDNNFGKAISGATVTAALPEGLDFVESDGVYEGPAPVLPDHPFVEDTTGEWGMDESQASQTFVVKDMDTGKWKMWDGSKWTDLDDFSQWDWDTVEPPTGVNANGAPTSLSSAAGTDAQPNSSVAKTVTWSNVTIPVSGKTLQMKVKANMEGEMVMPVTLFLGENSLEARHTFTASFDQVAINVFFYDLYHPNTTLWQGSETVNKNSWYDITSEYAFGDGTTVSGEKPIYETEKGLFEQGMEAIGEDWAYYSLDKAHDPFCGIADKGKVINVFVVPSMEDKKLSLKTTPTERADADVDTANKKVTFLYECAFTNTGDIPVYQLDAGINITNYNSDYSYSFENVKRVYNGNTEVISDNVSGVQSYTFTVLSGMEAINPGETVTLVYDIGITYTTAGSIKLSHEVKPFCSKFPGSYPDIPNSMSDDGDIAIWDDQNGDASGNSVYFAVTNTYTGSEPEDPEMKTFHVSTVWDDGDDADKLRPKTIHAVLTQDGRDIKTITLSTDNGSTGIFGEYPVMNPETGKAYAYGINVPDLPEGYRFDMNASDGLFDLTFTHTPSPVVPAPDENISVKVTAAWDDADNKDGLRPEDLNVSILKDGKAFKTVALNDVSGWMAAIKDLEGGHEYSVDVESPDGYSVDIRTTQTDTDITFAVRLQHTPKENTEAVIRIIWDDEDNRDNIRPDTVRVNLVKGEKPVSISAGDNWTYRSSSDTDYDVDYIDIAEIPDGYDVHVESEYDHKTLTVTISMKHVPAESGDLGLEIVWDDGNDADSLRPVSINGTLLQNEKHYKDITLSKDDGWKQVLKGIPKTDAYGNKYSYMLDIAEDDIPDGYDMSIRNTKVTFTHVPESRISVTAQVVWDDKDNADGMRPSYVDLELLKDGSVTDSGRVDADNFWSITFENLASGHDYSVRLKNSIDGYAAKYDGYTVTLSHEVVEIPDVPNTRDFTIRADWNDEDNKDGMRPDSVKVAVIKNGEKFADISIDKENGWKYDYTGLPAEDKEGNEIVYTVTTEVPEGYEASVKGFDITFTRKPADRPDNPDKPETPGLIETPGKPGMLTATVTLTWVDDDDKAGARPDKLTAVIRRNGEDFRNVILDEEHGWKVSVDDLPEADDNGDYYRYSVKMPVPKGYKGSVKDFDFTMTYKDTAPDEKPDDSNKPGEDTKPGEDNSKTETIDAKLSVTWNDSSDKYGKRPDNMEVTILQNGTEYRKVSVKASESWKYTAEKLPKYDDNKKAYTYTVKAANVPEGYKASVNGMRITMTYDGTRFYISAVWGDSNNKAGKRPDSFTAKVYRNDEFYKYVKLTKENGWKVTLDDLPKYDGNGKVYTYTVKAEDIPDGYEATVNNGKITFRLKGSSSSTDKNSNKNGSTTTTTNKNSTTSKPDKGSTSDSGNGKGEAVKTGQETYALIGALGLALLSGGAYWFYRKHRK